MSDDSMIRIGRPPQAAPPAPEPPKRRRKELAVALAAGLVIGIAVAGLYFGVKLLNVEQAAAPPVPMPSSGPNFKVLDVPATCAVLVPAALDGAKSVTALVENPDGSTVDWTLVRKTRDDLKVIAEVAAPELRDDINQQAALLSQLLSMQRTGNNMTLSLEDFRASGLRIGLRCKPYAS